MIERLRVRIPAGAAGEFCSPELTLRADSYSVSVPPPVLPQWHVKDPGHSAKLAGGMLHLHTHTPLTLRSRSGLTMLFRHSVGNCQRNKLTRNSSGNSRPQSSKLAEPLWIDPGLQGGMGELVCASYLHFKKKKRRRGLIKKKMSSKILGCEEKPSPTPLSLSLSLSLSLTLSLSLSLSSCVSACLLAWLLIHLLIHLISVCLRLFVRHLNFEKNDQMYL